MRILIVSPFFPPYSSVAVVRIASLTRYLINKGFEITVLTNKHSNNRKQINNDDIINKVEKIELDIRAAKGRYFKIKKIYMDSFHTIMRSRQFDVVLITTGPFYTLPLCEISKRVYNTKCILDFRDLWIFDIRSIKDFIKPSSLLRKVTFFPIEKRAIKYADQVITVTDGWSRLLKKVYPKHRNKINVIYNGYDDEYIKNNLNLNLMQDTIEFIDKTKFNIVSFGKLSYYSIKYSTIFFQALNKVQQKNPNVNLLQIGNEEVETNRVLENTGYNMDKYINTGFCDYKQGMTILSQANISIIIDIRKSAIGTKIYDYIFTNKPIIYVGKKNTYLSNFVSSFENGFSCQTEEQIIKAIEYIIHNNITYLTKDQSYLKHSRSYQNSNYLNCIEK